MHEFSLGEAWSKGFGFVGRNAAGHAAILIGVGIVVPFAIQSLLTGAAAGPMNQAMTGQSPFADIGGTAFAGTFLVATLVTYVVTMGSYYASWRLGFGVDETIGGALLYGLGAGALLVLAFFAVGAAAALLLQAGAPGAILVLLLPLLVFASALFTALVAAGAVGAIFMLLILAAFGATLGSDFAGAAEPEVGLGIMLVVGFAVTAATSWLATRFSCTNAVLADRKSYNLLSAMAESWRLTGPAQWRVMGFLATIGVAVCFFFLLFSMMVGAAVSNSVGSGGPPSMSIPVQILIALVVVVPLAYIAVIVPAGIYRALRGDARTADVFA